MDLYIVSMVVGAGGLASMALGGLDHHGGHGGHSSVGGHGAGFGIGSHGSHGGGSHGGGSHGGGSHGGGSHGGASHGGSQGGASHGGTHAAGTHGGAQHGNVGHNAHTHDMGGTHTSHVSGFQRGATWLLSAPRIMFSVLLGLGATGLVLTPLLGGVLQAAAAVAGGILFERFIITPIWNVSMKFESKPSLTLESTLMDEAIAVTHFDRNGEGIVSIELNGQIIQILATLRSDDRLLGSGVRAGQRVRIEDVDSSRNRCTVSVL